MEILVLRLNEPEKVVFGMILSTDWKISNGPCPMSKLIEVKYVNFDIFYLESVHSLFLLFTNSLPTCFYQQV